jgi:glycosyltransferase involved in cell wall biosynthesis
VTVPVAVSVVVPCRNEAANVPVLVSRVRSALETDASVIGGATYEIVLVDDGSTDGTLAALRSESRVDPRVRYVSLSRGFGKESAMLAGLRESRGDIVVLMDGDLQHPPELVPQMLDLLRSSGCDQVVGVRDRTGETRLRRMASRGYHAIASRNTGVALRPGHGDFRAVTRRVVDAVLSMGEVNRFSRGLFAWVGFDIRELPYTDAARLNGSSGWSLSGLLGYGLDGLFSFNERPLRIMVHLGWWAVVVFLLYVAYIVVSVAAFGIETPGYVTLVASIFFFGGLQLLSIGLLGEYLGRIYLEVKDRPPYVVLERGPGDAS